MNYFSLMLKLLAYFDEATVLLYFAQSVLVKISTNPLSAELRRRINNGKEGHLCETEPKQKIYTWLCCCSEKYSYNESYMVKKKKYLEKICQFNEVCFILWGILICIVLLQCEWLPCHLLW